MNIFVVSHSARPTSSEELIEQLSRIQFERKNTVPVVVVDDRYNLSELEPSSKPTAHTKYHLDAFLHDKGSVTDGVRLVDSNQIAQHMEQVNSPWVVVDFGQNNETTCFDFIHKLSRYSYLTPTLRTKNLLFTVPAIYLGHFARTVNESFNNLPASSIAVAQSDHVGMLFLSTTVEKVFVSLPFLTGPLRRVNNVLLWIYQRFVKAA